MTENSNRPVQMIFSFEGFINGMTPCEEVHVSWRPDSYDLTNFEERVRVQLAELLDIGMGGIVVNVGYDDYLDNEDAWQRFLVGVRSAAELGMRIWIYDENGYPSGTAGGKVLQGHPELEVVMPCVNRKGLGVNDGTLEEMLALLRELKALGKGVYAMKPLAGGHLFDDAADSLNYIRALGEVDSIAVGMKSAAEVEMNVCVFDDRPVPAELKERAEQVPKRLIIYHRVCQGCGLCVENCAQEALSLVDEKSVVDESKCILCGYCAEECPVFCIRVI